MGVFSKLYIKMIELLSENELISASCTFYHFFCFLFFWFCSFLTQISEGHHRPTPNYLDWEHIQAGSP